MDSPAMIIPQNGDVELGDKIGNNPKVSRGEVAFVMVPTNKVVIKAKKVKSLRLKLDE